MKYIYFNIMHRKKIIPVLIIILLLLGFITVVVKAYNNKSASENTQPIVVGPLAIKNLDRKFSFPIKDYGGNTLGNINYDIQSAELRNEIIVNGQKATAVSGRVFLIFNLKLDDSLDKSVDINTRDYLRLSVDNGQEWLAPDIHNDPITVQAISSKNTRLGFAIDENVKQYIIQVGEIDGQKIIINFTF